MKDVCSQIAMGATIASNAVISEGAADCRHCTKRPYIASVFSSRCSAISITPVFGSLLEFVVQIAIKTPDRWMLERQRYNFEVECKQAYFLNIAEVYQQSRYHNVKEVKEQARTMF